MHEKQTAMNTVNPPRSILCIKQLFLAISFQLALLTPCVSYSIDNPVEGTTIDIGERPGMLASMLPDSELKDRLTQCVLDNIQRSALSIGHRGAPLQYAEHTREGYIAAAQQGAGVLECDVTFTKDKQLVCRHSQCDLHSNSVR